MSYVKNRETADYVLFLTSEFSQWYPSDFTVYDEGADRPLSFNCAEQYMMYSKAMLFRDLDTAEKILTAKTPEEHKDLGRSVQGFDRDVWNAHARDIVYWGNYHKFTQNPHLFDALMRTKGKELVEAAHYDPVWGIGLRADDPLAENRANWKGSNWLGETLTRLREKLIADGFTPTVTDENRHMFKVEDKKGQRTLYISDKDFARQMGGVTAWDCLVQLTVIPFKKKEDVTMSVDIKGHGPLEVNVFEFLDTNEDVIAKLRIDKIEKSAKFRPPRP